MCPLVTTQLVFTLPGVSGSHPNHSCFGLEKRIEGGAVEFLGKTSDHENDDVSHMPCLHHQVNLIIPVNDNLETMLVVAIQLDLQGFISVLLALYPRERAPYY
jgi:hypothetical protein